MQIFPALLLFGLIVGCAGSAEKVAPNYTSIKLIGAEQPARSNAASVVEFDYNPIESIQAEQPARANCGQGLKIGMIDGPVDTTVPALRGQHVVYRNFVGNQLSNLDHGTLVARLLVGKTDNSGRGGLLPLATLYAANIFPEGEGGQPVGIQAAFVLATEWLISEGVEIVNISLTGNDNPVIQRAIERFVERNIIVVAAAGNNRGVWGRDYPAAYPSVLSATAIDKSSNVYLYASLGEHVDFAAPGVELRSKGVSSPYSGSSFAVPFLVAAVAAELKLGTPRDPNVLRRSLARKAIDLGIPGKDIVFGYGRIALLGC